MKKIAVLVASVLVLGSFSTKTLAAEVTTQTTQPTEAVVSYKDEAGITPDSLLYTIDKAVDQLRVMMASSEEEKAAVNAEIAEERLGESEVMTEEGKVELAQKALEEYSKAIAEATQKLQAVVANLDGTAQQTTTTAPVSTSTPATTDTAAPAATDTTGTTTETAAPAATDTAVVGTEEAAADSKDIKLEQSIAELEEAIKNVQDKSLVVLHSLKAIAPAESAKEVEKTIKEQTAHKEAVANFVRERHEFNAAKKELNMARVALKKAGKKGSEDTVKAAQARLDAAKKEYLLAQTELHAAFQAKEAADLGIVVEKDEAKPEETAQVTIGDQVKAEDGTQAVVQATAVTEKAAPVEAVSTATEYSKTNNGNGNKSAKVEKEDDEDDNDDRDEKHENDKKDKEKSAPGKSGEAHGKANKGNGKRK